jgi:2-haloacid dehalogenase
MQEKVTMTIKALAFDAYGTIFDVHSVIALCEEFFPGRGAALSQLWRSKQLEYTWLRSLMNAYEDFWHITEAGLTFACASLRLALPDDKRARLMNSYLHLTPYPDVAPALKRLQHFPLAILSNGAPRMLHDVVANARLSADFKHLLSVDSVKIFKPHASVYQLAPDTFGVAANEIGFVSSNGWDIAGASHFGFTTFWINRHKQPVEALGKGPYRIVSTLHDVADELEKMS